MAKKQPLPGVAVACIAFALLPESGSVRLFNFQSTSLGTVSLAIPLERKQDSVSIRNGSSFPGWCLWKVVLLKRQSEIYPPGAAFANSFTISSMMSEDAGEAFLKSAFPFLLRGPEQKAASSLWHQCNLENWASCMKSVKCLPTPARPAGLQRRKQPRVW